MSFSVTTPAEEDKIKMLVFGNCGSGKTHFCGTAADSEDAQDVLMISPDKGEITIRDKDIDVIRLNHFKQIDEIYEFLRAHVRFRNEDDEEKLKEVHEKFGLDTSDGIPRYNTVILDSLTELGRYSEQFVVGNDLDTPSTEMESMEGFQDWEDHKKNMVGMLSKFRDLDVHFLCTATEKQEKDEKTGEISIVPNISGAAKYKAEETVHIVGYSFRKKVEGEVNYGLMFAADEKYACKQRFDLPDHMKDPTFEKVYEYVQ